VAIAFYDRRAKCPSDPSVLPHGESHYRRADVIRWSAEEGVLLSTCKSRCGGIYRLSAFTTAEG
jgi:hypothetical protein